MISNAPFLCSAAVFARELDRAFVGLRAGVGKEHLVEAAVVDQRLRQLQARLVVERRARRQQPLGLRGKRVRDDGGEWPRQFTAQPCTKSR